MQQNPTEKQSTASIKSQFKITGGFGFLVILNLIFGYLTLKILLSSDNTADETTFSSSLLVIFFLIGLNLLFLWLLMSFAKSIIIDKNGITFRNPVFSFIMKKYFWSDLDYYIELEEESETGAVHEALWLIKDHQVKGRISAFFYSNYKELKSSLRLKNRGKRNYTPIFQLLAIVGLKQITD